MFKHCGNSYIKRCRIANANTDAELQMLIQAGIADLNRQGIVASVGTTDNLVQSAIVMFVKANFGNVDIKEKELAQRTYSLLCANLGLSEDYKAGDSNA